MSPSKKPSPLTEPPKSEDCLKSVSGPVTIKKNEKNKKIKKEMNPMDNILSPPTNIHENTLNPVKKKKKLKCINQHHMQNFNILISMGYPK